MIDIQDVDTYGGGIHLGKPFDGIGDKKPRPRPCTYLINAPVVEPDNNDFLGRSSLGRKKTVMYKIVQNRDHIKKLDQCK
jgi:hypothetical protein